MAMENLVGDAVPSEAEIEKLLKEIDATRTKLGKYTYDLNAEGRQRALKPPEGSESTTELIARLLTKHEVSLPGVSAEEMLADLALARRMSPLVDALTTLLRTVQDTILQANSERWGRHDSRLHGPRPRHGRQCQPRKRAEAGHGSLRRRPQAQAPRAEVAGSRAPPPAPTHAAHAAAVSPKIMSVTNRLNEGFWTNCL